MNISTNPTSWPKSFVLILLSLFVAHSNPCHATSSLVASFRSRSLAAEHNFPLSAWRGLGDGGKQQRWRSRRGEARGWDREVGGEGRGGSWTRWKKQLYTNDRLPHPHNAASMHPPSSPTCSDVALCGHRTASKRQARRGEGRILKETASLSSSANTTASETRAQSALSTLCTLLNPPAKCERKK